MRVTKKYLTNWINEKFKSLEMDFEVEEIVTTHYRQWDYEGGACRQIIRLKQEHPIIPRYFLCFYSIAQIQDHLDNGYELWLKFDRMRILNNTELDLRKIN